MNLDKILRSRRAQDRLPIPSIVLSFVVHSLIILGVFFGWRLIQSKPDFSPFISASLMPAKGLPEFRPRSATASRAHSAPRVQKASKKAIKLPSLEKTKKKASKTTKKEKRTSNNDKKTAKTVEKSTRNLGNAREKQLGLPDGRAGGVGAQSGSITSLNVEEFEYTWYSANVAGILSNNWVKSIAPPELHGTRVIVRFRISRDGSISDAYLIKPSDHFALDQEVLRAVYKSSPLPPLPSGFEGQTLVAQYEFVY